MLRSLAVFVLLTTQLVSPSSATRNCNRRPVETEAERTSGSNGFHLKILPYPRNESASATALEGYIPGEEYTIVLEGWRAPYTVQTFRGFSIVAVKADTDDLQPIGKFKIGDRQNVRFSQTCHHAVTHVSRHPKTEVEVIWQAPSSNVGCVQFRAMVLEYQDIWYMDEGPLSKKFCQLIGLEPVVAPANDECCACEEAKYELVFEGIWSRQTHPKEFPPPPNGEHLTHFSDLIGASHSSRYSMWAFGAYSSDGMKEIAEWGNTHKMEQEMKKKARDIRTIVKARGLWYPNVQGVTRAVFRVDKVHHLLSLASMLGPSPDWLVGISAINLCMSNCSWQNERSFDLTPFDAGTDSGTTYMSPNRPTLPREPIKEITNRDPPTSPFYDAASDRIPPLARLTIRRQKTYDVSCGQQGTSGGQQRAPSGQGTANSEEETSETLELEAGCEVSEWAPWSDCSATCGKGLSMRSRTYVNPVKSQMMGCKRHMIGKIFCNAAISECHDSPNFNDMCAVSDWNAWTECSVTCGKGLRSRTRQYDNPMAMKKCSLELMEKDMCIGPEGMDCSVTPDPRCRTSYWSEWSPCSVTCGQGLRVKTRLLYYPENLADCPNESLMEKQQCTAEYADCQELVLLHRNEICTEPMESGQCSGNYPRYFYDVGRTACLRFIYSGCRGNRNNFESESDCERACITSGSPAPPARPMVKPEMVKPGMVKPGMRKPGMEQSDGSEAFTDDYDDEHALYDLVPATNTTTNHAFELSNYDSKLPLRRTTAMAPTLPDRRLLERLANALHLKSIPAYLSLESGLVCVPAFELAEALGVNENQRVHCMATEWTSWSECSRTCGRGRKQRTRMIKVPARNGGDPCPTHLVEKVRCSLRPCHTVTNESPKFAHESTNKHANGLLPLITVPSTTSSETVILDDIDDSRTIEHYPYEYYAPDPSLRTTKSNSASTPTRWRRQCAGAFAWILTLLARY